MTLRLIASARLVVPVAALLLAAGCKDKDAAAEPVADSTGTRAASNISLPVVGQPVRKGDLVLTVTTTGQVRSDAVSRLKAENAGTVQQVLVVPGQRVAAGDLLLTVEAMKLEHPVHAPADGVISDLRVGAGSQVETGTLLAVLAPD